MIVTEGFPSSQDFAGQFPEPAYVFFSPFPSRSSVLTEGLRVSGYDEDVAILASKSLKPGTCRQFQSGWGKFGRHFAADKLRHEDVPTSSFGNF